MQEAECIVFTERLGLDSLSHWRLLKTIVQRGLYGTNQGRIVIKQCRGFDLGSLLISSVGLFVGLCVFI